MPLTVEQYLSKRPSQRFAIFRHDVDRKVKNAIEMAEMEADMGIFSTYYFRMVKGVYDPEAIKQIENMGHEIGYHYEVIDKAKGDVSAAIKIFEKELNELRELAEIKTIASHGNPLTRWKNYDLWEDYDFGGYKILGEAYLSIDYSNVTCFTDLNRKWIGERYSLDDYENTRVVIEIKSTVDLIDHIVNDKFDQICILAHPNRWNDDLVDWTRELIFQNIKNIGKNILKIYRSRNQK
ncbi:MAG: hypothetical protein KAU14_00155 [Thermoplasmata archaeon]|nr:hypothetical protein [Thermoplasmata archaeon]